MDDPICKMATEATCGETQEKTGAGSPLSIMDDPPSIDFLHLTPSKFGISVQSFTSVSSNQKDKSRLAQIKARRRTNIGVRGSPETNSLIRFMAQQKMNNVLQQKTPEGSPFLPRIASTLKQKMASFQSLIEVEENDFCGSVPKQINGGGCVEMSAYLTDMKSLSEGKENHPPVTSPAPSKRRRVGSQEVCEMEIKEAGSPSPHLIPTESEEEEPAPPTVTTKDLIEALLVSPPSFDIKDDVFEDQSSSQKRKQLTASEPQQSCLCPVQSMPSEQVVTPTEKGVKKKRVHFGDPLPPEFFDKNLPPSTPLQKGGTPGRIQTPGGDLKLRSLLKTPQRNELNPPSARQHFGSPVDAGASPKLSMPRNRRMKSLGDDKEMEDAKMFFPSIEELDSAEFLMNPQQDLNAAFQKETPSPSRTVPATKINPISQSGDFSGNESVPEMEKPQECPKIQTLTRACNRTRKSSTEPESPSEAPARSRSKKRKLSDSEPVKRSSRTAAKSASGKIKTSTASRQWKKEVNRSLYSNREYASKLPALSPISESLSFILRSSSAVLGAAPTASGAGEDPGLNQDPGVLINESPVTHHAQHNNKMDNVDAKDDTPTEGAGEEGSPSVSADDGVLSHDRIEDQTEMMAGNGTSVELTSESVAAQEQDHHVQTLAANSDPPKSYDLPDARPEACSAAKHITRGRRSSVRQAEALTDEVEKAPYPESTNGSGFVPKDEGREPNVTLAPWQTEFNFEDVFKPVATRGQRSVRRSLRNQKVTDDDATAGLAWVTQKSPDFSKKPRQRSRNCRLPAQVESLE